MIAWVTHINGDGIFDLSNEASREELHQLIDTLIKRNVEFQYRLINEGV